MPPAVAELLAAFPVIGEAKESPQLNAQLQELFDRLGHTRPPVGSLRRLFTLGGLQARLGGAYIAYWLRGWFKNADRRKQDLLETHLRAAFKVLDTMGYLRGAVMKLGQVLANLPTVVPDEYADLLGTLHFQAPPMHYALLREYLTDELGKDPEEVFDSFETTAFAAASLGQVHRARLKTGEPVAVKIQYPGIARTIRADFRNLFTFLFPIRWTRDWEYMRQQCEYVRQVLELETDYEREADNLRLARALMREDDGIVVPRVYPEYSTRRVLTMEYINGRNFAEFLNQNTSQETRDGFATKMVRASMRLFYAGRMFYADPNPGNFLFLDDGRLGSIDFGCICRFTDAEWESMRQADAVLQGTEADIARFNTIWAEMGPDEQPSPEWLRIRAAYTLWSWKPFRHEGPFDFGDARHYTEGVELLLNMMRLRDARGKPLSAFIARDTHAFQANLYRMRARVDYKTLHDEEVQAAGWR